MWRDDPANPGRLPLDDPRARRLIVRVAPGATATDLGGTFSLNVLLEPHGLVLRVHQPFVSRTRMVAVQVLKHALAGRGLRVATAVAHEGATVVRCDDRWAEIEAFIPGDRPKPSPDAYRWLFASIGALHRELSAVDVLLPAPLISTYASPETLLRWFTVAERSFRDDASALASMTRVRSLLTTLRRHWTPARRLPRQMIHGDARLGNFRLRPAGETVIHDFGFAAHRPRIHELAYSLTYMVQALEGHRDPGAFDWSLVPVMIEAYECAAGTSLSDTERRALLAYMAAVPLYHAVTAGLVLHPEPALQSALPFVDLSEWLLTSPAAGSVYSQ